jgi:hypothetical protein
MKLEAWCKANPKKAAVLKDRLGKKTFYKYRKENVSRCDPETLAIIVEVSKHQVTANDFYGINPIKAAEAAMALEAA